MQTAATKTNAQYQQPAGVPVTLRLAAAGAVFGVFKQGRGRYFIASLCPSVHTGWLPCEVDPLLTKREALSCLQEHLDTWAAMVLTGQI